jgi:hypothetical protein
MLEAILDVSSLEYQNQHTEGQSVPSFYHSKILTRLVVQVQKKGDNMEQTKIFICIRARHREAETQIDIIVDIEPPPLWG